ncbi:hypothetical protein EXIGLDRAFT_836941 [Exidia glandulosa HHB12029]|uniref:F-box domain-containing protein n=1 Tax=Exidia glandulosa HHB12029 TaxID=1314781 RepID=A0A165H9N0_EXIGL|nr:hypothetical protein EXIGLDRAFT_836941 [Exidia glandulosa HHB12029]
MPRAWFAGMCHAVEAILDRVQYLSLELPDEFEDIVQAVPPRSRTTPYSSQTVTAWTFEHMLANGAPRLSHFEFTRIDVDTSIFQAPHERLSNLRTLVVERIPSLYGAKDLDELLAFLPNLEELSVWLSGGSEELLAPCAFTTVHCKLRHLRVNQPQGTAFNVITLCAVFGSIQILAIDSDSWCGTRPSKDIHNVLPIITSISLGSGICEYVARRSLDERPMRILCSTGGFGWTYLEDILNAPTFSHLTTLSFHEFFFCSHRDWSHRMQLPALPDLIRLRIMLASCRDYRVTLDEFHFADPPARTSILANCDFEWDLPALRTVHISFFLSSRCDDEYRSDCTCRPTMSLALSDICSFSPAPLRWSGSNCTALRLSGFNIVDVDADKYLCSLYTMFQEITISEQCEPECWDVDAGVWYGTQLSIFRDPLVIGS